MPARFDLVVHNLDDAIRAAEVSQQTGVPFNAFSARLAAASLGPAVFLSIMQDASRHFPRAQLTGILDCGFDAGKALEALYSGVPCISVDLATGTLEKVSALAIQLNAEITPYPKNPLDLASPALQNQDLQTYLEKHKLI